MARISSPIAYPPSSSPPTFIESRKRPFPNLETLSPSKRRLGEELAVVKNAILDKGHIDPIIRASLRSSQAAPKKSRGPFYDEDDEDDSGIEKASANVSVEQTAKSFWPAPISQTAPYTPPDSQLLFSRSNAKCPRFKTSAGRLLQARWKDSQAILPFERLIAERSNHQPGKASKSFYGIEIHDLLDQVAKVTEGQPIVESIEISLPQAPSPPSKSTRGSKRARDLLWTEKYRAKKYTDLVGDERTHRDVLRWIKGWDQIVFPGAAKPKPIRKAYDDDQEAKIHKKVLLLTGPPGLGKTTLAHVCAKQAGYEVLEINASDERSRDVVKGKIKDCVGTDNVRITNDKSENSRLKHSGKPFCVVVDEVDGVVAGNSGSGGEGGFIKALIDLILLDQKNTTPLMSTSGNANGGKRKGERFRLLRPIILICNDAYHPSLRPLRSSTFAEVIQIRRPPLDKICTRLKSVLDNEGVPCDNDGVRRLCEATWGISDRREARPASGGMGEGDMRSILVAGEWIASKLKRAPGGPSRLSKKWVEDHVLSDLAKGGDLSRGLGRGGTKEAVERVFQEGAGFSRSDLMKDRSDTRSSTSEGVSESAKRAATQRLQEIIETSGDSDRIMTDCFSAYPSHQFQDDTFLSKPNAAYDWLHFHDCLSSKVHTGQEWELFPYLSQPILGFHQLFASPNRSHSNNDRSSRANDYQDEEVVVFSGPRADFEAYEAMKQHKSICSSLQSCLTIPLLRSFKSIEDVSLELVPHVNKMLHPNIKPILVGGSGEQKSIVSVRKESEKDMAQRAARVMAAVGVRFERARIESAVQGSSSWVYRMEP